MKSTLQHLRFLFSFLLMPVFFYSLVFVNEINITNSIILFIVLHLLVYPASNGYNGYMDNDKESVGGIKNPLPINKSLFYTTILFDFLALLLCFFIDFKIVILVAIYIAVSKLYSWRYIRLKQFPILGFLSVFIFQGAFVCYIVAAANNQILSWNIPLIASFLFGGAYPITQIYQHKQDLKDNVKTISIMLGITNTFIFCATMFASAMLLLFITNKTYFWIFNVFLIPVVMFFSYFFVIVLQDKNNANYINTMRINWITAICLNSCFIYIILYLK